MATYNNLVRRLFKTLICVGLYITIGECKHLETNSNQPLEDTTQPGAFKLKGISETQYKILFGGLSNTDLGRYLSQQINKIDSEINLPAYSVYHHWHLNGYTPITTIEGSTIGACSENALLVCLPGTIPMCITNGITYCVLPQYLTVPCEDFANRSCVISAIRETCIEDWRCVSGFNVKRISMPCIDNPRVLYRTSPSRFNQQFYIIDFDKLTDNTVKENKRIGSEPNKRNWFYSGEFCVYMSAVPTKSYKNKDFIKNLSETGVEVPGVFDDLLSVIGNYVLTKN